MPGRNLAKPFAIAGFIIGEIITLFAVLGPYGKVASPPPVQPLELVMVEPGTPRPLGSKIKTVLIAGLFMGPFGAIAGTGLGLLASGLRGDFRRKDEPPA